MIGSRNTSVAITAALAVWLTVLTGCALRVPAIDPTGERIFVPGGSTTLTGPDLTNCQIPRPQPAFVEPADPPPCPDALTAAPASAANTHPPREEHAIYGPNSGKQLGRIVLMPAKLVAPVGSEVVLLAGLCDPSGHFIVNEPIEWIMSQESVGNFVDVGEPGSSIFPLMLNTGSKKLSSNYALGRTAAHTTVMTRGTEKQSDDFLLKRGQNWVSITSPTEGVSHVTVWAPNAHGWDLRRQTATIHWVDAQWALPGPAVAQAGQPFTLRTRVTRASGAPATGWFVRYEILDDAAAHFLPTRGTIVEVPVDPSGDAAAQIASATPGPLTARVRIQILRPGAAGLEANRVVVGEGMTTVTWSAAGLSVRVSGPPQAGVGEVLTFRVEVSNPGDLYSHSVILRDVLPPTLERLSSLPAGALRGDYAEWQLGDIGPQEARVVTVNCRATREGLIQYCFRASADGVVAQQGCAEVTITTPRLRLQVTGPDTAQVGQEVTFDIDITNTSGAPITGVTLTDRFDPGLRHVSGNVGALELPIGTLAANQSRTDVAITFTVVAVGRQCHTLEVTADGGHRAVVQRCVVAEQAVVPPSGAPTTPPAQTAPATTAEGQLSVRKSGPRQLEANQHGRFVIQIINMGDAPVTNIRVVDRYEPGLEPVQATIGAVLEENRQAVAWTIREIPPGGRETREVVARATQAGDVVGEVTVSTEAGLRESAQTSTRVTGGADVQLNPPSTPNGPDTPVTGELTASIIQFDRPTAVGNITRVLVRIKNDRDESDRNVTLSVKLPDGFRLQRTETPPGITGRQVGDTIRFRPIPELRAKEVANFEIEFIPQQAGMFNLEATIESVLTREPVELKSTVDVNERN